MFHKCSTNVLQMFYKSSANVLITNLLCWLILITDSAHGKSAKGIDKIRSNSKESLQIT